MDDDDDDDNDNDDDDDNNGDDADDEYAVAAAAAAAAAVSSRLKTSGAHLRYRIASYWVRSIRSVRNSFPGTQTHYYQ